MPYAGPAGPEMLEAAPVNVRVTPVEFCHPGSTTTLSPDSSTPLRFDVVPDPCASTLRAAGAGGAGVGVGVRVGVEVFVGVMVRLGVDVGVLVTVGVDVLVGVAVGLG